jgi:hypothetical protein
MLPQRIIRVLIEGDMAFEDAERCRPSMGGDVAEQGVVRSPGSDGASPYQELRPTRTDLEVKRAMGY